MPKAAMKKDGSSQPLSAMSYVIIALVGLLLAAGFTAFYIYKVPELVNSGVEGKIFYLLLIPWALASAAFLFGAMKSFASLTSKQMPYLLELGGPVVLFCLVLVGGYKLVPPAPENFTLTVRPYSAGEPIVRNGEITIDFGNDRKTKGVGTNGEAYFNDVSTKFKSAPLKVLPEIEGYENKEQTLTLEANSDVLKVLLVKAAAPATILQGRIDPPPANPKTFRIVVDGQKAETSPDDLGRFELSVNGQARDRVRLIVYANGKPVYDDFQQLPGPVTLTLHRPN